MYQACTASDYRARRKIDYVRNRGSTLTMPNQDVREQAFGGQSVQKNIHVHLPKYLPAFRTKQAFR